MGSMAQLRAAEAPKLSLTDSLIDLSDLEAADPPPSSRLFGPILEPTTTLLHAPTGVGKSMLAHEIALAVATGKSAFTQAPVPGWELGEPGPVLLIDGELPLNELRRRLSTLRRTRKERAPIRLLSNAQLWQEGKPLIDLSRRASREALDEVVAALRPRLVVLDNLATLTGELYDEDGAAAQRPLNAWQAAWREEGISTLLIHHDNKSGKQRGSSDRETISDLIIHVTRLPDSRINEASFAIHYDKARFLESNPIPFTATLTPGGWRFGTAESGLLARFLAHMHEVEEFNYRDVMIDLEVSKPTVYRLVRQAQEQGLWQPEWKGPKRRARPKQRLRPRSGGRRGR